jgi:hypothetical protein
MPIVLIDVVAVLALAATRRHADRVDRVLVCPSVEN